LRFARIAKCRVRDSNFRIISDDTGAIRSEVEIHAGVPA